MPSPPSATSSPGQVLRSLSDIAMAGRAARTCRLETTTRLFRIVLAAPLKGLAPRPVDVAESQRQHLAPPHASVEGGDDPPRSRSSLRGSYLSHMGNRLLDGHRPSPSECDGRSSSDCAQANSGEATRRQALMVVVRSRPFLSAHKGQPHAHEIEVPIMVGSLPPLPTIDSTSMSPLATVSVLQREPDFDGLPPMVAARVGQVLRVSSAA